VQPSSGRAAEAGGASSPAAPSNRLSPPGVTAILATAKRELQKEACKPRPPHGCFRIAGRQQGGCSCVCVSVRSCSPAGVGSSPPPARGFASSAPAQTGACRHHCLLRTGGFSYACSEPLIIIKTNFSKLNSDIFNCFAYRF